LSDGLLLLLLSLPPLPPPLLLLSLCKPSSVGLLGRKASQLRQSWQLCRHMPRRPSIKPGASSQKPWAAHMLQHMTQTRQQGTQRFDRQLG
jgi:hypothetical protein